MANKNNKISNIYCKILTLATCTISTSVAWCMSDQNNNQKTIDTINNLLVNSNENVDNKINQAIHDNPNKLYCAQFQINQHLDINEENQANSLICLLKILYPGFKQQQLAQAIEIVKRLSTAGTFINNSTNHTHDNTDKLFGITKYIIGIVNLTHINLFNRLFVGKFHNSNLLSLKMRLSNNNYAIKFLLNFKEHQLFKQYYQIYEADSLTKREIGILKINDLKFNSTLYSHLKSAINPDSKESEIQNTLPNIINQLMFLSAMLGKIRLGEVEITIEGQKYNLKEEILKLIQNDIAKINTNNAPYRQNIIPLKNIHNLLQTTTIGNVLFGQTNIIDCITKYRNITDYTSKILDCSNLLECMYYVKQIAKNIDANIDISDDVYNLAKEQLINNITNAEEGNLYDLKYVLTTLIQKSNIDFENKREVLFSIANKLQNITISEESNINEVCDILYNLYDIEINNKKLINIIEENVDFGKSFAPKLFEKMFTKLNNIDINKDNIQNIYDSFVSFLYTINATKNVSPGTIKEYIELLSKLIDKTEQYEKELIKAKMYYLAKYNAIASVNLINIMNNNRTTIEHEKILLEKGLKLLERYCLPKDKHINDNYRYMLKIKNYINSKKMSVQKMKKEMIKEINKVDQNSHIDSILNCAKLLMYNDLIKINDKQLKKCATKLLTTLNNKINSQYLDIDLLKELTNNDWILNKNILHTLEEIVGNEDAELEKLKTTTHNTIYAISMHNDMLAKNNCSTLLCSKNKLSGFKQFRQEITANKLQHSVSLDHTLRNITHALHPVMCSYLFCCIPLFQRVFARCFKSCR